MLLGILLHGLLAPMSGIECYTSYSANTTTCRNMKLDNRDIRSLTGSVNDGIHACEAPSEEQTYCWGFSRCGETIYLKGMYYDAACNVVMLLKRMPIGWYVRIPNKDYRYVDIGKYNIPVTQCVDACVQKSDCDAVMQCGDTCYLKKLADTTSCSAYLRDPA